MNIMDELNYDRCSEILTGSVATLNNANFTAPITVRNRSSFEETANQFLLEMRIGKSTSSLNNFSNRIARILKELNLFNSDNDRYTREVNSMKNFITDNYKGIRKIMLMGNPKGFIENDYMRETLGEYRYNPKQQVKETPKPQKPCREIKTVSSFSESKEEVIDYSTEDNVYTLKKIYYDGVQLTDEQIARVKELERQEYIDSHKSDYESHPNEFNDNGLHCDDRITYGIACAFRDI